MPGKSGLIFDKVKGKWGPASASGVAMSSRAVEKETARKMAALRAAEGRVFPDGYKVSRAKVNGDRWEVVSDDRKRERVGWVDLANGELHATNFHGVSYRPWLEAAVAAAVGK